MASSAGKYKVPIDSESGHKMKSCVGVAERVTSREVSRPACIDHPGSGLTVKQ
jgi:hypothetical protein